MSTGFYSVNYTVDAIQCLGATSWLNSIHDAIRYGGDSGALGFASSEEASDDWFRITL